MEKIIENIQYYGQWKLTGRRVEKPLSLIGIDTEAYTDGKCFLICTSWGDAWSAEQWPTCAFSRKYRGGKFAAWNLKYDEGTLLQWLSKEELYELWKTGKTEHEKWRVHCIPQKMLSIRRGSHSITVYDMYQFYGISLEKAARAHLNEGKEEMETKNFTPDYFRSNREKIISYCRQDAVLVEKLSAKMVGVFKTFGITPSKLYSTAYVSFQYFKARCVYPTVRRFWEHDRPLLGAAMKAYRGGKFEVTRKGVDHYVEYDIISAYPQEIAQLEDITYARVVHSRQYRRGASYAFLRVKIKIPDTVASPVSAKVSGVSIYPVGELETWITKGEYDYLERAGCDLTILEGYWIHVDAKRRPFAREINRLVSLKQTYKAEETALEYHTAKILLNSLYGKMVQLVKTPTCWKATSCWNPIYAAVITANVRIKVSSMQQAHSSVVAVHTDSVISTRRLPISVGAGLGDWVLEREGRGVILGSGIYQIGGKTRMRGFDTKHNLIKLIDTPEKTLSLDSIHAVTWRECAFHGWSPDRISRFEHSTKKIRPDFDTKRFWIDDYRTFRDVLRRKVESYPLDARLLPLLFA